MLDDPDVEQEDVITSGAAMVVKPNPVPWKMAKGTSSPYWQPETVVGAPWQTTVSYGTASNATYSNAADWVNK